MFKWSARSKSEDLAVGLAPPVEPSASDTMTTSKVLPRFLSALANRPTPVLVDLGPVVGSNVSFFGERLACKIYVEDLFAEVERHAKAGNRAAIGPAVLERLTQPDDSVDGILCWDLFDFLDRTAGQAVATRLASLVRPGGVLYGFFGSTPSDLQSYSRYAVESDTVLRVRSSPATPTKRTVLTTRDIIRMFEGLTVTESVLLKTNTRETLFRRV